MSETNEKSNKQGVVTESCGCVFNWNDKFYESQCAEHLAADEKQFDESEQFWCDRFADETGEDYSRF